MIKDIYGTRVRYRFKKLDKDTDGEYKNATICIDSSLTGKEKTITILHEEIHAIFDRIGLNQAICEPVEEIICESISKWIVENYVIKDTRPS